LMSNIPHNTLTPKNNTLFPRLIQITSFVEKCG